MKVFRKQKTCMLRKCISCTLDLLFEKTWCSQITTSNNKSGYMCLHPNTNRYSIEKNEAGIVAGLNWQHNKGFKKDSEMFLIMKCMLHHHLNFASKNKDPPQLSQLSCAVQASLVKTTPLTKLANIYVMCLKIRADSLEFQIQSSSTGSPTGLCFLTKTYLSTAANLINRENLKHPCEFCLRVRFCGQGNDCLHKTWQVEKCTMCQTCCLQIRGI